MDTLEENGKAGSIILGVCKHFGITYERLNDLKWSRRLKKIRASLALRMRMEGFLLPEIAQKLGRDPATISVLIKYAAEDNSIATLAWRGEQMDVVRKVVAKKAAEPNAVVAAFSRLRPKDKKCVAIIDAFLRTYHKDLDRMKIYKHKNMGADPFAQIRMHAARHAVVVGKCTVSSVARCLGVAHGTVIGYDPHTYSK